jgi:hypothetical protein
MQRVYEFARNYPGVTPAPGATITVYEAGTTTLAELSNSPRDDEPKSNPFTADSIGFFFFFVDGAVDIHVAPSGGLPIPF